MSPEFDPPKKRSSSPAVAKPKIKPKCVSGENVRLQSSGGVNAWWLKEIARATNDILAGNISATVLSPEVKGPAVTVTLTIQSPSLLEVKTNSFVTPRTKGLTLDILSLDVLTGELAFRCEPQ